MPRFLQALDISDQAAQADADEVDKHWLSTVKDVITIGKALFVILTTIQAAMKWRKSNMRMATAASNLLLFNAMIVAGVTVYKHTSKTIAPLFALQAISNYSAYLIFVVLTKYVESE